MRYFKHVFVLEVLLLPLLTSTYAAELMSAQTIELTKDEPTIQELHQVAIRYAEVSPDKIKNWRR